MEKIYDIVVVGGGPAGLTAALYGLRNGKDVLVIEKSVFGGQIVNSPNVENIPGFVSISGDEYGDLLLKQVQAQGGNVMFDEVLNIENDGQVAKLKLDLSDDVYGKTVILATGTIHRTLGLENEDNLIVFSRLKAFAKLNGRFLRLLIIFSNDKFFTAFHNKTGSFLRSLNADSKERFFK